MKKSQLFTLAGFAFPALVAFAGCTGPEPAPVKAGPPTTTGETPTPATTQDPQGQPQEKGGLQDQQRAALLADALRKARRALDIGKWVEALRESSFALKVDPNSAEARDLFTRAQEFLGEKRVNQISSQESAILRWQVQQTRDEARATTAAQVGDAQMAAGRFSSAVESYERAVTILKYSPFHSSGSALFTQLSAKLEDAKKARTSAMAAKVDQDRKASEEAQAKAERLKLIAQRTRARRLFEDANRSFQDGQYQRCLDSIESILQVQPWDSNALALKELASRARHDQNLERLRRTWKSEWSKLFDELSAEDLPQNEVYRYDLDVWRTTRLRGPLEFKSVGEEDSPEEAAIMAKLNSVKQEFTFNNATLADWAKYFGDRTEINFIVNKSAAEMDAGATTLTAFQLPPTTAARALDIIAAKTGVRWRINNSTVELVSSESKLAGGRMYYKQYLVNDIVEGVPSKPGIEPKLSLPGDEAAAPPEEAEAKPTIVDAGKLQELIRANIGGDSWDSGGATISELRGSIIVRHTRQVHKQIDKLLADLREAVGIQVDVESRFLQVTDNFLEDVGVDFRGLGNNSAEGVPGRGIANRPNVGFDDFGRRENINPASPGTVGTGTEPGAFFDDGGDGDFFGRTENLFDSSLNGDAERDLTNAGGLSLQWAYLNDTELEMILRAVAKNDRSQEITAPRLLVYNNTRANMSVLRQTTYIKDFEVEIAQAAAVANPVIGVVKDGVALDVRPVVSADRRFITMELRPTVLDLVLPIPTFTTTLGVGQPITLQLPRTTLKKVRTTVTMPDGGTVLLGGMKISNKTRLESGIPVLSQIPIISFLFGRRGESVANTNLLILIRATIIIPREHEPKFVPNYFETLSGGGK